MITLTLISEASVAHAEPSRTAEDIVHFFSNAINVGPSKEICVSSKNKCASEMATPQETGLEKLVDFDLNLAVLKKNAHLKLIEFAKVLKDNALVRAKIRG
jgi:outer membrane protein OmpA-like peptidoglycan-associated protein